MRKINVLGRITAFILAVILIFTAMPLTALADNGDNSLTDGYGSFIDGAQVINDIISEYMQLPQQDGKQQKKAKTFNELKDEGVKAGSDICKYKAVTILFIVINILIIKILN